MSETVYAWLIENGKDGEDIRYRGWAEGWPYWVKDPYKALWFVRREDAEAISAEDEDAWRIVEHGFEVEQPRCKNCGAAERDCTCCHGEAGW